jgi:hypothetical protein
VGPEEDLYVRVVCTKGVRERLEDGDPVLGTISLLTKGGEREPMRSSVSEVKLAVGLYGFVCASAKLLRAAATMPSNSFREPGSALSF